MDVSVARFSPAEHYGLEVERPPPRIRYCHVHYPLDLVALGLVAIGAQNLHHHVQGPSSGQGHVL